MAAGWPLPGANPAGTATPVVDLRQPTATIRRVLPQEQAQAPRFVFPIEK